MDGEQRVVSSEVGVINNQVDYEDDQSTEQTESNSNLLRRGYYSTLPNKKAADTLATLAVAGNINNQIMKTSNTENPHSAVQSSNKQVHEFKVQNVYNNQQLNKLYKDERQDDHKATETTQQSFHHQKESIIEHRENQEQKGKGVYINHNMGRTIDRYEKKGQQRQREESIVNDYSEEELLEASDNKDMNKYSSSYYGNQNTKEVTINKDQSYEDSENDYNEEELEITEAATIHPPSSASDKTVNYIYHQNQLPFGAKLRPKRVS